MSKIKIIAEVGSNFKTLNDCLASIAFAKACGADYVKFQMFSNKELYGIERSTLAFVNDNSIKPEWLPDLKAKADQSEIGFMCTAFSPQGYLLVDPYVSVHKVAASENCHKEMIKEVLSLKKPVLLSVGGGLLMKDQKLLECYHDQAKLKGVSLHLLYSISSYPAKEFNPLNFLYLEKNYDSPGISDHTLDISLIPSFVNSCLHNHYRHDVLYYEKHVNLVGTKDTPDAPHSLNLNQFTKFCKNLKDPGQSGYQYGHEDAAAESHYQRRLIALKDIDNQVITRDNVGFFRPDPFIGTLSCIADYNWDQCFGKTYKGKLNSGDALHPRFVE